MQVPLSTPEQVAAAEATPIVVKEGVTYVTKIVFSVHKDVVLGLKFATVVSIRYVEFELKRRAEL